MADATTETGSPRRSRPSKVATERLVRSYFEAIARHDLDAAVAMWAPGGREHVRGQADVSAPEGVRDFIGALLRALPDLHLELVSTTAEADRCAVQWRITGTFTGQGYYGLEPTGDPLALEGIDLLTVREGLIVSNDAFTDGLSFARQIGLMPPQGSLAEQRLTGAFNVKTRLQQRLTAGPGAQPVADGVWMVQGRPGRVNAYLLADEEGVTLFDAGTRSMVRQLATAAAPLGGVRRIVLGHAHSESRGAAPAFDVPVLCHPDEVSDVEGKGGLRYWDPALTGLPPVARQAHRLLHRFAWDGGPVSIAGTVSEGDEIAGFRVVDLPGHAPGLIGLWRESDRLALASDAFYSVDVWGRDTPPRVPPTAYNYDTAQARASVLKLAALEPAAAWPGHGRAVTSDVRAALERAAGRR